MMITIDGAAGEGGGQILRTALGLAMVTGKPFRLERIRAGRSKPGLMRQHLTCVEAARQICGADVEGAALNSQTLSFHPGVAKGGDYRFSVGTAGSTTLVLQTVLPALMLAKEPSSLRLEGGTHNPAALPFDFLEKAFLPIIKRMGVDATVSLERYGFYPAGGGAFEIQITPTTELKPVEILERGPLESRRARALLSSLPVSIGERETAVITKRMSWPAECASVEAVQSPGPGNVVLIELQFAQVTEVFIGFGQKGVRSEVVSETVVAEARHYLKSDAPVGEHLADQLLVPFALAGGGAFRTGPLSRHATTNIDIIKEFLEVEFDIEKSEDRSCVVRVREL